MVDHEFFEYFVVNGLNPEFKLVSRNTVRSNIIKLHEEMKVKIYEMLKGLDCKINDWNLDKKLFSMAVDNAADNDSNVRHLKIWLSDRIPYAGEFFHVLHSAHILNIIVQDEMDFMKPPLINIRGTVRYLSKSPFGKQKFDQVVSQLKLQGKAQVPMDVPHMWNTMFDMIDADLVYEETFDRLAFIDKNYAFKPSEEEWILARSVHGYLKPFKDATMYFSGTKFPTVNVCFPDICDIKLQLIEWENSSEEFIRVIEGPMRLKFSKFWDECGSCLAIYLILDPRFKMDIIEYYYDKLSGSEL
ncbi:zinc finger BED domain-containing protein RICESLEEPER 2-like [Apium graveolens]|uniref:zinc finger BED domain-containing protein RICESLEEPER 2-like n=1 Tax=Apium graveolens TaxID=4045 RepID=UPI003D7A288A